MGRPKALVGDDDGSWLERAANLLLEAGCSPVIVVLGAAADEARALVPAGVRVVIAEDWTAGMSASLRTGLAAAAETDAPAALITLVDLPRLPLAALVRVLEGLAVARVPDSAVLDPDAVASGAGREAVNPGFDERVLRQARWDGGPGHPVLIGRAHWTPLAAQLSGDEGARGYLATHGVIPVECSDLGDGSDVDQLPRLR